jgi:hypothetical protein
MVSVDCPGDKTDLSLKREITTEIVGFFGTGGKIRINT